MPTTSLEYAKLMQELSMITMFGYSINIYAIIVGILFLFFLRAVLKANKDPENDFDWIDLVMSIDQATGERKASVTKILQLVGGGAGTFIVIKLALQNNISFDIFAAYLAYVASIEGFSKFMIAKYGVQSDGQQSHQGSYGHGVYGGGYSDGYRDGYRETRPYQPYAQPPVNPQVPNRPPQDPNYEIMDEAPAPKPRDID